MSLTELTLRIIYLTMTKKIYVHIGDYEPNNVCENNVNIWRRSESTETQMSSTVWIKVLIFASAEHWSWIPGGRSKPQLSRFLSGGFQITTFCRVPWAWHLQLLCYFLQLLDVHYRAGWSVPSATIGNIESWRSS